MHFGPLNSNIKLKNRNNNFSRFWRKIYILMRYMLQIVEVNIYKLSTNNKLQSHRTFFPSTLELLKNLQQMGAAPTLMTNSRELRQLIKDYDQMYSTEQGVYANWELLYFSAINKQ